MRKGWRIIKIGDVCEKTENINWKDNENLVFKYIDLSSVSRDNLQVTETSDITSTNAPSRAKKIVRKGDVIFATTRPTLKRVTIIESEFDNQICSTGFVVLRSKKSEISPQFIYYFIQTELFMDRMELLQRGTSYPAVTDNDVKKTLIPIPPLEEQKQIVAILDKAFAAIDQAKANVEKNLQNAKELFQSKLNEIFSQKGEGWEEKKLGEVCKVLNGYAFKSKDAVEISNTQLLRMGNLYQNEFLLERKPVFYPDSYIDKYKEYLLKEGDLIMSLTGTVDKTDYGYTVRVTDVPVNLLLNQRIMKIELLDIKQLDKEYLRNYLLSPDFLKRLYATASGTRQANLSSRTILDLSIVLPSSLNKQKEIVEKLQAINKGSTLLCAYYNDKIKCLEELKKSILQKAFAGELTLSEAELEDEQNVKMAVEAEGYDRPKNDKMSNSGI